MGVAATLPELSEWTLISFFVNIEVNNLRKNPVLQLKQSSSPLILYLLNEQVVREKHVLGHKCHRLDNKKWPERY